MSDESSRPDESAEAAEPAAQTAAAVPPAAPAAPRVRWQDRVLRLPAVIGVALATLIMGGFGGLAVGAIASHWRDRHDGFNGRHMRMGPHEWGPGRGPMGSGEMGRGQLGRERGWFRDGDPGDGADQGDGPSQSSPSSSPSPNGSDSGANG